MLHNDNNMAIGECVNGIPYDAILGFGQSVASSLTNAYFVYLLKN